MAESYQNIPSFEQWYNQREHHEIFREYIATDPKEVRDFVYGCNVIKGKFEAVKPDVAFFPERGAAPIAWAIEELYYDPGRNQDEYYRPLFIPIGTKVEPTYNVWRGISDEEKHNVIMKTVQNMQTNNIRVSNPILVDEVQSGGTLSFLAPELYSVLKDAYNIDHLHVIAAKDSRTGQIKSQKLRQLIAQRFSHLPTSMTLLPLFFVDRVNLLDIIVEDEFDQNNYRLIRNGQAETFIKLATQVALIKNSKRINFLSSEIIKSMQLGIQDQANLKAWLTSIEKAK